MALSTSPIQVSNYTIGSSLQPGKLVVLNGQMDAYDIQGRQTVVGGTVQIWDSTFNRLTVNGSGQLVGTRILGLSQTTTNTTVQNNASDAQTATANFTVPTGALYLKVEFFCSSIISSNGTTPVVAELWKNSVGASGTYLGQGATSGTNGQHLYVMALYTVPQADWGTIYNFLSSGYASTGTGGVTGTFQATTTAPMTFIVSTY